MVEGGIARKAAVELGTVSGELAEVKSGLATGAQVVVRGGFNLKDGEKVAAREEK